MVVFGEQKEASSCSWKCSMNTGPTSSARPSSSLTHFPQPRVTMEVAPAPMASARVQANTGPSLVSSAARLSLQPRTP